jgi:hypothetical protein
MTESAELTIGCVVILSICLGVEGKGRVDEQRQQQAEAQYEGRRRVLRSLFRVCRVPFETSNVTVVLQAWALHSSPCSWAKGPGVVWAARGRLYPALGLAHTARSAEAGHVSLLAFSQIAGFCLASLFLSTACLPYEQPSASQAPPH